MDGLTASFHHARNRIKRLFARKVGIRGLIHCVQIFCMALGIAYLHMGIEFLADLWPLGAISLTVCGLASQTYAQKSKMIAKAILLQFILGSAIGLVICVIFPGQWYFSLIGIFLAYAIWGKLRPKAFSGLAAVIVNVLFFDFLVRDGQLSAVFIGAGVIVAEAALGALLAIAASRIVNIKASDALVRQARDVRKRYARIFVEVVEKKRFRASIAETQAERVTALAAEARMVEKPDEARTLLIGGLVEAIDNAYYHLYTFDQVEMNFTQRVKEAIQPSEALYTRKIREMEPEPDNERAGLSYLHVARFVRAWGAIGDVLQKLEGHGHAG